LKIKKVSKVDAAYIAGFFDGEGCVSISHRKKYRKNTPRTHLAIRMSQAFPNILYHIQKILGVGRVHKSKHIGTLNYKSVYKNTFSVYSIKNQLEFLQTILPYSKTKKEEIVVAIKFIEFVKEHPHCTGNKPMSTDIHQKKIKFSENLRELKKCDQVEKISI